MPRVLILSGLQISTNPRVVKEATALAGAGFEVEVLGASLDRRLIANDNEIVAGAKWKYTELVSLTGSGLSGRAAALYARLRRRTWIDAGRHFGVGNIRQLGYCGPEMLAYSLTNPADLYIVHTPAALCAGVELMRRGRRVAADFEDWFSEDFPLGATTPNEIEMLRKLEREVLRNAVFVTTTSRALSHALSKTYDCPEPFVVYNAFPHAERAAIDGTQRDRTASSLPSLHWFSQYVGPGRGLELLMQSLHLTEVPFEIHLRGRARPGYLDSLLALAPSQWRRHIHFHEPVPHHELLSRICEHDATLASEQSEARSRHLTISNKALHSLLGGVPVIASETEGQREVASLAEGAVFLYDDSEPANLANLLSSLFANPQELQRARDKAFNAADTDFSWIAGATILVKLVHDALSRHT